MFLYNISDRVRDETCCSSKSKASREKMRRDRLNDRYYSCVNVAFFLFQLLLEKNVLFILFFLCYFFFSVRFLDLTSVLDPGRPPKSDKASILSDAVLVLAQLRSEAEQLKEANIKLQETIKQLKVWIDPALFFSI